MKACIYLIGVLECCIQMCKVSLIAPIGELFYVVERTKRLQQLSWILKTHEVLWGINYIYSITII